MEKKITGIKQEKTENQETFLRRKGFCRKMQNGKIIKREEEITRIIMKSRRIHKKQVRNNLLERGK